MPNFEGANNFSIFGSITQIENYNGGGNMNRGFELLLEHVVTSAYDANDLYDQPRCHPRTRERVQDELLQWAIKDNNKNDKVMWVNGPAGAGKSAIARSVFERKGMNDVRGGFFAFKRGSDARDKVGPLIPTLAYQISTTCPEAKVYICRTIERDPKIFSKSIETQLRKLIIEPLEEWKNQDRIFCFVIDGLDECTDARIQATIITSIVKTLAASKLHLKFMIFSRPELEIRATFRRNDILIHTRFVELDEHFQPDQDIELFIREKFGQTKISHGIPPSLQWPSEHQIGSIIRKSTGQFIYPATIIKYIDDYRKDPIEQLNTIIQVRPNHQENPLAELDALYTFVLEKSHANYEKVSKIFMALIFGIRDDFNFVSSFLRESIPGIRITLANLHSVVRVPDYFFDDLLFFHASFIDFLEDDARSDRYFVGGMKAHNYMARRWMDYISNFGENILVQWRNYEQELGFYKAQFLNHLLMSNDEFLMSIIEEYGEIQCSSTLPHWIKTHYWNVYAAIGNTVICISNWTVYHNSAAIEDEATVNVDVQRKIFSDKDDLLLPCLYVHPHNDYMFVKEGCGKDHLISTISAWLLEYIDENPSISITMCSSSFMESEGVDGEINFEADKAYNYFWDSMPINYYPIFFNYLVDWIMGIGHINLPSALYFHIFRFFVCRSENCFQDLYYEDLDPIINLSQLIETKRADFANALERLHFEPWRIETLQMNIDNLLKARIDCEASRST